MEIIPSTPVRSRRTGRLVLSVLACVLVVVGLLGATPVLRGMERVGMADDAMGSALPKGSYVLVRQVPARDLQVGDLVSFGDPAGDGSVIRRITAMDGGWLEVSGDADGESMTLRPVRVREVVRHVPYAGYPMLVMPAWPAPYLLAGFLGALMLGGLRVSGHRERRRPRVLVSVVVPRQAPSPAREAVPTAPGATLTDAASASPVTAPAPVAFS